MQITTKEADRSRVYREVDEDYAKKYGVMFNGEYLVKELITQEDGTYTAKFHDIQDREDRQLTPS